MCVSDLVEDSAAVGRDARERPARGHRDGSPVRTGQVRRLRVRRRSDIVAGMPVYRLGRRDAGRGLGPQATSTAARARARSSAAATNSRKSGAGRVGRDLNSGWNCEATNHGWSGSSIDLDEPALLEGAADDEPGVDQLLAEGVVHLVAVAVALGDHRLAAVDLARARSLARARPPGRRGASCRRGPRSPSARAAGRSRGTASPGPSRSSSRPSRPQTWRANSETATCMPRQMPRYGI